MEAWQRDGYISHPDQLYRLRRVTLSDGKAKGTDIIEAETAGRLELDLLPEQGLDIGCVRYRGQNVSYISKNGYVRNCQPFENEFMHYFPGGLLYTCGLRSTGPAHDDSGEWHPLHGRFHTIPAEHVCAGLDGSDLLITGTIRETALFGHVFEVHRSIRIPVFDASITIKDEISNLTPAPQEYALIYHCNFGWPLVSEKASVFLPENRRTTPRTEFADTGLDTLTTFVPPVPGEEERVFFHEDMEHYASILNPDLGIRMSMSWSDTLPILAHWRSMAAGDYVCGLEPTNSYIMGRKQEREHGTLKVLEPYESVQTSVTIRFDAL